MSNLEYILWGTPKGSNDPIDEKVLYTQGKSIEDIQKIERLASADGWHSFRVQELDLDVAPDFGRKG